MANRYPKPRRIPRSRRQLRQRIVRLEAENRRLRELFPDGVPCDCVLTDERVICEVHRAYLDKRLEGATGGLDVTIASIAEDPEIPAEPALRIVMDLRSLRVVLDPEDKESPEHVVA